MTWDWLAFVVGVLVGTGLMWLAAVADTASQADREPERFR